jgi:hypothetical protein
MSVPNDNSSPAFIFGVAEGTAYDSLSREAKGGWLNLDIINGKPVSQRTSSPLDTLSLSGKWFGEEGMTSIDKLRDIKNKFQPVLLTDNYGYNLGLWKIMQVTEKQSRIIDDGTAMVTDFSLQLEEFAND